MRYKFENYEFTIKENSNNVVWGNDAFWLDIDKLIVRGYFVRDDSRAHKYNGYHVDIRVTAKWWDKINVWNS